MKRLLPALLASTALALVPGAARAQTVTKTGATSIGLGTVNGVAGQPIFLRGSTVMPLLTSVPAGPLKGVNGIPTAATASDLATVLGSFGGDATCNFASGAYACKVTGINGTSYPQSGLIKSVSGAPTTALAGTDYIPPTQAATSSALGLVKPDGTTLTNSSGAISVTYGTGANTAAQGNDSRIVNAFSSAGGTVAGNAKVYGAFGLDTTFSAGNLGTPTNGAFLASGGNAISYVPIIQGVGAGPGNGPTNDHQRATGLFTSITTDDGHSQENTVGIETDVKTGYAKSWAASTSYSANDNISVNNAIYRASASCTSGSTAPSGFGNASQQQTDGSCTWTWINAANISAKLGLYSETVCDPGAGQCWNTVLNTQLRAGMKPTFNEAFESDFGNNAANCAPGGGTNCNNVDVETGGNYTSTHSVLINSTNTGGTYATYYGLRLSGLLLDQYTDIETDANGAIGIGVCSTGYGACSHTSAGYYDQSSSPIAMQFHGISNATTTATTASTTTSVMVASAANIVVGQIVTGTGVPAFDYVTAISGATLTLSTAVNVASGVSLSFAAAHTVASIVDDTTTPTSLSIAGSKSFAGIYEHSTTPVGLKLAGTYGQYQIGGLGFTVDPNGNLTSNTVHAGTSSSSGVTLTVQNSAATCSHTATTSSETVTCSSDRRLKARITEARGALAWLDSFDVREFDTRKDGSHHTGAIAQEVQQDHPELVHDMGHGLLGVEQPDVWKVLEVEQELYRLIKILIIWSVLLSGAMLIIGHRLGHTHWVAKNPRG